ncbi:hypothetical protein [Desulfolucanica intricata]|uniref:hypothetical protein n=1 Tax=Desulfolucanica intricata TaxID=1285191 RepID=UPI00082D0B8B|nr:hypothetical protein [Desulfolucanica intricata]
MIRCPNCNQSSHAYMRGGAFIAVSLDGKRLLVDTNADMKNTDFLNPDDLGRDSTLICPQCGKIAGAYEWKDAWNRKFSSTNQVKVYPAIKIDYKDLKGYLSKRNRPSSRKVSAFGWCDYN